jgi:hypothetical protein
MRALYARKILFMYERRIFAWMEVIPEKTLNTKLHDFNIKAKCVNDLLRVPPKKIRPRLGMGCQVFAPIWQDAYVRDSSAFCMHVLSVVSCSSTIKCVLTLPTNASNGRSAGYGYQRSDIKVVTGDAAGNRSRWQRRRAHSMLAAAAGVFGADVNVGFQLRGL